MWWEGFGEGGGEGCGFMGGYSLRGCDWMMGMVGEETEMTRGETY